MLDRPSTTGLPAGMASAAPLILLPGTLCDARVFAPVLSRLDRSGSVLPLAGARTAREMASLILADAPDRLSLCGFSLGAIIALEIIALAPHRVDRLALIGCNPGVLSIEASRARAALPQDRFLGRESERHMALLEEMAKATPPQVYAEQTAMTLSRTDSRARLPRIAVDTMVLCGADDTICPPQMSRDIAAAIPHARLAIIEGAGHYVMLDRPDRVADELAAWLARPSSPSFEGKSHGRRR